MLRVAGLAINWVIWQRGADLNDSQVGTAVAHNTRVYHASLAGTCEPDLEVPTYMVFLRASAWARLSSLATRHMRGAGS